MAVRRRRTAEESRQLILSTAARRLGEYGLEGLNITGVADDAGLSHATLIHHFGSSEGMRDALTDKMTVELIHDMMAALNEKVPPANLINNLFSALNEGGHAKLLAWRAVAGKRRATDFTEFGKLFDDLLRTSLASLHTTDEREVKKIIFLVTTAALGYGIVGPILPQLLGMSEADIADFPAWVAAHLTDSHQED